jgi:hypothetical protein
MNASDWHFLIQMVGIASSVGILLRNMLRIGRSIERIDNHIKESNEIHKVINERITWLERRRRLDDNA